MRLLVGFVLVLAVACGAPASSGPSTETPESDDSSAGEPTDSVGSETEPGTSGPPQCVAMGEPCDSNGYCCYGSCRAEDDDPTLLCRP